MGDDTRGCPVDHTAARGGCPVDHGGAEAPAAAAVFAEAARVPEGAVNPANNVAVDERQRPVPGQRVPLSTARQQSSIPKGTFTPAHQSAADGVWVYPSEQQYYSAMRRKGWTPPETDVPAVLSIHNAVNEETWRRVLEWETARDPAAAPDVRLQRFCGRPKDLSPKARLLSLFGYSEPFDRHDWVIERSPGGDDTQRYVIDFYTGKPAPGAPVAIYLDVRPALDSPSALFERVKKQVSEWLG